MKLRIVSGGEASTTRVLDLETGKFIKGLRRVDFCVKAGGRPFVILQFYPEALEIEGEMDVKAEEAPPDPLIEIQPWVCPCGEGGFVPPEPGCDPNAKPRVKCSACGQFGRWIPPAIPAPSRRGPSLRGPANKETV